MSCVPEASLYPMRGVVFPMSSPSTRTLAQGFDALMDSCPGLVGTRGSTAAETLGSGCTTAAEVAAVLSGLSVLGAGSAVWALRARLVVAELSLGAGDDALVPALLDQVSAGIEQTDARLFAAELALLRGDCSARAGDGTAARQWWRLGASSWGRLGWALVSRDTRSWGL